jgi:hypothetical protein
MGKFKDGQEIWVLEKTSIYKPTVKDIIRRCVYYKAYGRSSFITYIIDNKPGMSRDITSEMDLFETLEELKVHIIDKKKNEILELQRKINWLNDDIDYFTSLKDVKEDRERKLNELDI